MAIVSPLNAIFFPSLFILCCHPKCSFFLSVPPPRPRWQIAAIHPIRNPLRPSSLPLQLWHICFHIHFMIFPKALPCSQHRWSPCNNSSSYRNLITICALIRSHRRQQENLDFERNPNLISTIFSAFKLLPNDTNKLSCTDMAKNRSTTPDASFLVQWGWFRKWKSGWKKVLEKISGDGLSGVFRTWGVSKKGQSRFAGSDTFPHSEWTQQCFYQVEWICIMLHWASANVSRYVSINFDVNARKVNM